MKRVFGCLIILIVFLLSCAREPGPRALKSAEEDISEEKFFLPLDYTIKVYPDSSFQIRLKGYKTAVEGRIFKVAEDPEISPSQVYDLDGSKVFVAWKVLPIPIIPVQIDSSRAYPLGIVFNLYRDRWSRAVLDSLRQHRFAK